MKKFFTEKRVYCAVLVCAAVLLLLVNIFFQLADEKWNLKIDTTGNRLYELSDTTEEILKSLDKDTLIYVLEEKDSFPAVFAELLSRYALISDKLSIEYISPFDNPVFMDSWQQQGVSLSESDILVNGSTGYRQIPYDSLLVYSGDSFTGINLERELTGAIVYVNSEDRARALFTTGHNERSTSSLLELFEANNIDCVTSYLDAETLSDYSLVVIASPTKDFSGNETAQLEAFLNGGGKLMFFSEPGINGFPRLSALLEKWNLAFNDDTVFEGRLYTDGNPINIIPLYTTHSINSYFETNQYYAVLPGCRSIATLKTSAAANVTPLLMTSAAAYAKSGSQYSSSAQEASDKTGNFVLAAISESSSGDGAVFALGSRYAYADDIMGTETYANKSFLAQVIQYLSGNSAAIDIPAKTLTTGSIAVSHGQELAAGIIFIGLIPLAIIAAGIVVRARRRRL